MYSPVTKIQIIAFLDLLAAGLIVPQLPTQARSLGLDHIAIGFMGSLYSGFKLVSSFAIGTLCDLKGHLRVLLVSLTLSGIAYTLLGMTNSVLLFVTLRGFLGITKHTQYLTKELAPDHIKDKEELSQVFGRLHILRQAGMAIGPIIGGHIVQAFPENGFTIIAFLVGAIFALNSGLIRSLPKLEKEQKRQEKEEPAIVPALKNSVITNFNESIKQFYKIDWQKNWEIFSFKLLLSLCMGMYICNYVLFLKVKHDVSPVFIGYIIALFSITGSLSSFFINHFNNYIVQNFVDMDFTMRNRHVFALLTICLIGLSLAPNVSIYVLFIIPLSVASTLGRSVTQELILCKTNNDDKETALRVANTMRSVTGVIVPLLTGIIAQGVGVLQVIYVPILLAAVGTYKSYLIKTKSAKEKEDTKQK